MGGGLNLALPKESLLVFIQTQLVRAAVLKSHLRPLKRSLDMRLPTSGVQQEIWRAKVLTQDDHKGIVIRPRASFEGKISQSQINYFYCSIQQIPVCVA